MSEQANAKTKKNIPWGGIVFYGICIILGVLLGLVLDKEQLNEFFSVFFVALISFVICLYLHIIFHEAGHMIFGMMTGYRFVSFRVASLMWEKQKDGKFRFSRFSLAGTGGQCLMSPPEYNNGNYPYRLYNLGGGLVNFILSAICGLLLLLSSSEMMDIFLTMMVFSGIVLGATNLIPMKKLNNDGSNLVEIGKSTSAKRAFWLQMHINEEIANGVRLKDMPEEWFEMQEENRQNIMVTSVDVLGCNRLMDMLLLDEAKAKMLGLMRENCLAGVYRNLLIFELSFLEMLQGTEGQYTEKTAKKEIVAFAKAMKNFPSILRWQYAKAKLVDKNEKEAQKIQSAFDKMAKSYPHPCEIEGEKELMQLVNEKAAADTKNA